MDIKKLEQLYEDVKYLTMNHGDIGGHATITAKDLGEALEKVDPEWWRKVRK